MADNYQVFSQALVVDGQEHVDWITKQLTENEQEETIPLLVEASKRVGTPNEGPFDNWASPSESLGFYWSFEDPGSVWLRDCDGSSNMDHVAFFVHQFMRHFGIDGAWYASWASYCSRPILGEQDGGAVVVTQNAIEVINAGLWAQNRAKELALA